MSRARSTLFVALFLLSTVGAVFAETTVLLATGPDQRRGIPYLSANVIPYLAVSYLAASQSTSAAITSSQGLSTQDAVRVFYSGERIVPDSGWKPLACGTYRLLAVQSTPAVYFFDSRSGWTLFFRFPATGFPPCTFVATFIERFRYFLGITQQSAISSFPAVLQLP